MEPDWSTTNIKDYVDQLLARMEPFVEILKNMD